MVIFYTDCIGSAFNSKGVMQCPNCRKIEKGRWLYATGSSYSFPEFSFEDWPADEDPREFSYSEMVSESRIFTPPLSFGESVETQAANISLGKLMGKPNQKVLWAHSIGHDVRIYLYKSMIRFRFSVFTLSANQK